MPMPLKPTPVKYCVECATKLERKRLPNGDLESLLHFNRRKFCDQKCMGREFDKRHRPDVGWAGAHDVARSLIPKGPCNRCGRENARDVHHKDHNFQNNSIENLERICRSCHNLEHTKRASCVICGQPQKGLGYCNKHYIRFKKHGDPVAWKIPPRKKCLICGAPANSKELCGKHYMQAKRGKLIIAAQPMRREVAGS